MADTPKGLATVAFLKARLDQNQDHLGLFEPLVADSLRQIPSNEFGTSEVRDTLCDRTGIAIPIDMLQTVLGRFVKRGVLRRAGGRYLRTNNPVPDPEFEEARLAFEGDQARLASAFMEFANEKEVVFGCADDALTSLAAFVSDNKVHLLLKKPLPDSPLDRSTQDRKITRLVARFISQQCLDSDTLRPALDGLVEGIIIEDTLLLRDIKDSAQLFKDLTVVIDTPLLFPALQMSSTATAVAVKEGLHLLRQAGAKTVVFDTTVEEMRRILSVYEIRLATSAGRLGLYPTELSRHVLKAKLTPGDIRLISATLQERLGRIGISVRELPPRVPLHTLNEEALAKALVDQRDQDLESPRIRHDVDVVAGVLTLRKGHVANSLERSGALFVTTSGRVVRNTQEWYSTQNEGGIPPIVHHLALTSIAWLKKPGAAPSIKIHELAAICAAALRPTRETWGRVLTTLRTLATDGLITNDEAVSVVVSELIEPTLARLDDEVDPDADSIIDAIDRVRDSYRREASLEADAKVAAVTNEMDSTKRAAAESVARAESEARLAQDAASEAMNNSDQILGRFNTLLELIARVAANILCGIVIALLLGAAVLSIPGAFDAVGTTTKIVSRVVIAVAALFGFYSAVTGGSVLHLRRVLTDSLQSRLRQWLE